MDFGRLFKVLSCGQIIGFFNFVKCFHRIFAGPRRSHIKMRCCLEGKARQGSRLTWRSSWKLIRMHRVGGAPQKSSRTLSQGFLMNLYKGFWVRVFITGYL